MPRQSIYADECIQRPEVRELRARGIDLVTALEENRRQASDDSQLEHATSIGRAIVTYNARHFRRHHHEWSAAGRRHPGIIIVPQTGPTTRRALRIAMIVDWIATLGGPTEGMLFEWNDVQRLLEGGQRLEGYSEDEVREVLGQERR